MQLVPWSSFGGELNSFRGEMDRLRNRFFSEMPLARTFTEAWLPSVDISETKDKLLIKAEEAKKKEIEVKVK